MNIDTTIGSNVPLPAKPSVKSADPSKPSGSGESVSRQDFIFNGRYVTKEVPERLLCKNCSSLPQEPMVCSCKRSLWCRKCITSILKSEGMTTNGIFLAKRPVCKFCDYHYSNNSLDSVDGASNSGGSTNLSKQIKEISTALSQWGYPDIFDEFQKGGHEFTTHIYQPLGSNDQWSHLLHKAYAHIFKDNINPFMDYAQFNVETLKKYLRDNTIIDLGEQDKFYSSQQSPNSENKMVFDFYNKHIGLKIMVNDPNVKEPVVVRVRTILESGESRMFEKLLNDEIFRIESKGHSNHSYCSLTYVIDTSRPLNNVTLTVSHCMALRYIPPLIGRLIRLFRPDLGMMCLVVDGSVKPISSKSVSMTLAQNSAELYLPVIKSSMIVHPYVLSPQNFPAINVQECPLRQYDDLPVFSGCH